MKEKIFLEVKIKSFEKEIEGWLNESCFTFEMPGMKMPEMTEMEIEQDIK